MLSVNCLSSPFRRLCVQRRSPISHRFRSHTSSLSSGSSAARSSKIVTGAVIAALGIGYAAGSIFPPQNSTLKVLAATFKPVPPQLPLPETAEGVKITTDIETSLLELPEVRELTADTRWRASRPHRSFPPDKAVHSLTAGALRGPGKLAVHPLVFVNQDDSEAVIFLHLGRSLCGHDGIIHGGLCATILDEALGRIALQNLPSKLGVTASLTLSYKAPTFADQFVVMRTRLSRDPAKRPAGRKVWVEGRLETLKGQVLVEAEALFVEPRAAAMLKNSMVKGLIH